MEFKYYQEIKIKIEKEEKALEEKRRRLINILKIRTVRILKKYLSKNITIKYFNCFDNKIEKKGLLVGFHVRYDNVRLFFEKDDAVVEVDKIIEISVNKE